MEPYSYLGKGWGFPPAFVNQGQTVQMLSAFEDIESSLRILIGTATGERVMQPDFGCNMEELIFESLDATMKTYMKDKVFTAILYHEPRVDLSDVVFHDEQEAEGLILIEIIYSVRGTNSRKNMVYPFYKNEAMSQ
ncbi:MAG: GPW/gp25 family protein [Spirosomataceae bacterium]